MFELPPLARKTRRQVLGLLAGAGLVAPAAIAQEAKAQKAEKKASPAAGKKKAALPILKTTAIVIAPDGTTPDYCKDLHLKRADKLVVANFSKQDYWFRFPVDASKPNSNHSPLSGGDCLTVPGGDAKEHRVRLNSPFGTYKWYTDQAVAGQTCPTTRPTSGDDNGDITIDP